MFPDCGGLCSIMTARPARFSSEFMFGICENCWPGEDCSLRNTSAQSVAILVSDDGMVCAVDMEGNIPKLSLGVSGESSAVPLGRVELSDGGDGDDGDDDVAFSLRRDSSSSTKIVKVHLLITELERPTDSAFKLFITGLWRRRCLFRWGIN